MFRIYATLFAAVVTAFQFLRTFGTGFLPIFAMIATGKIREPLLLF